MVFGRIIKLALVALLTTGLGVSVSMGDTRPFGTTTHLTLSAADSPGDCTLCKDCSRPCGTSMTCGAACISSGLVSANQVSAVFAGRSGPAPKPDWQTSSADLLTPTPPPRLTSIA